MTFEGLFIGASGLFAGKKSMDVIGHNIANSTQDGYTRQRARYAPQAPVDLGTTGILGMGVEVTTIEQISDAFVEQRLRDANANESYTEEIMNSLRQMESLFNELTDNDLSSIMGEFWNSLEDLADRPADESSRVSFIQQAEATTQLLQEMTTRLASARVSVDNKVTGQVVEDVNSLLNEIAQLNSDIVSLETAGLTGDHANDLRDERNRKVKELSGYIDLTVYEQPNSSYEIVSNGQNLVTFDQANQLTTVLQNNGDKIYHDIRLVSNGVTISVTNGRLAGMVESRDQIIGAYEDDIHELAGNLIYQMNIIHSQGVGLKALDSVTSKNVVNDATLALNDSNLSLGFTPVSGTYQINNGSFNVEVVNNITGEVVATNIAVDLDGFGADTTLTSLTADIDAVANINANIDPQGHLVINADSSEYSFRFSDDNTNVLAFLGVNVLFEGYNASTMAVNSDILNDFELIAVGKSSLPSDNTNILDMLALRETKVMSSGSQTFDEYYQGVVGGLGVETKKAMTSHTAAEALMSNVQNEREEISGVSLDEEMSELIRFQRAYQASARYISTVNFMLDVLISM